MDHKAIISKYLKEKNNEDELISFMHEQKKVLANSRERPILLNAEYVSLMIKLARKSNKKIKYSAIILLSNIESCMEAKNFYGLCHIAAENSKNKDGNVRQASFILIKNINAFMITLPLINKLQNASQSEVNLYYESFRGLFYKLCFAVYNTKDQNIRKGVLRSLEIMAPKFYDMAKFWNDQEDITMSNRIKEEMERGLQTAN